MRAYLDQRIQMRNNPDEECKDIHNLFKQHIDTNLATLGNGYVLHQQLTNVVLSNIALLNTNLINMMENDVIFVKCPSITEYHFLTAIFQEGELIIFQKFGQFGRTYVGKISPIHFFTLYRQYFMLMNDFLTRTPLPSIENKTLTQEDLQEYQRIIELIYKNIYGINNLSYYVLNHRSNIDKWLELKGTEMPDRESDSYDNSIVYDPDNPDLKHERPYRLNMKTQQIVKNRGYHEMYEETIEVKAYEALLEVPADNIYTIYKYIQHPAGVGVGPRKKFNALRMFKQFAKQHSSEIQSSIRKSSSAKFQTKKRKAPRTKKTKRRRK